MDLTDTDRRILRLVQRDGRVTVTELAQHLGLPATTAGERLKRLLRDGVITGFRAEIDPRALGLDLLVFVEVLLDKTTPEVMDQFVQAIRREREVLECHMVAGGFDFLIKLRMEDMAAYRRFLGERLWALPGVKETRTYTVMEEVQSANLLPVR